jgi:serine/threonine protein kinase
MAGTRGGQCAACLLEGALVADTIDPVSSVLDGSQGEIRQLTIHVPLGTSRSASVFLTRKAGTSRLLRLKTWHTIAPSDFLDRFQHLRRRLAGLNEQTIDLPLAASVSADGHPFVLSVFRRGTPLFDRVRQGRLDPTFAVASLEPLIRATRRAHAAGLIHGSVVAGNVMFDSVSASSFLLDFGLAPLVFEIGRCSADASADDAGFALLTRMLREASASAVPPPAL